MKLSLWQQFSSNHSASYTVVGQFLDETSTMLAYDRWRELIWAMQSASGLEVTEFEKDYASRYQIQWYTRRLDWFNGSIDDIPHILRVLDHYIFISTVMDTWQAPEPVRDLMTALGAVQTFTISDEGWLKIRYRCQARTVAEAEQIAADLSPANFEANVAQDKFWTVAIQSFHELKIEQSGRTLEFECERWGFWAVRYIFTMVHYLEARGCQNIEWQILLAA